MQAVYVYSKQALGFRYLRLDCVATPRLRAVYERFGFEHHSDRQVGPTSSPDTNTTFRKPPSERGLALPVPDPLPCKGRVFEVGIRSNTLKGNRKVILTSML